MTEFGGPEVTLCRLLPLSLSLYSNKIVLAVSLYSVYTCLLSLSLSPRPLSFSLIVSLALSFVHLCLLTQNVSYPPPLLYPLPSLLPEGIDHFGYRGGGGGLKRIDPQPCLVPLK